MWTRDTRTTRRRRNALVGHPRSIRPASFLQPLAKGDCGEVASSGVGQIGVVGSCRARHVGKWRDETACCEIIRHESSWPHGDTKTVQRRLERQIDVAERQRPCRLEIPGTCGGEPVGPDPWERGSSSDFIAASKTDASAARSDAVRRVKGSGRRVSSGLSARR
jgi:hypothetical protein